MLREKSRKSKEWLAVLGIFAIAGLLFLAVGCEQEPVWEEEPSEPILPEEEPAEGDDTPEGEDMPEGEDLDF